MDNPTSNHGCSEIWSVEAIGLRLPTEPCVRIKYTALMLNVGEGEVA